MKKIILSIFISATAVVAYADANGNDAMPPIPVLKEAVKGMVKEQEAEILDPQSIELIRNKASAARKEGVFNYPNHFIAKPVSRSIRLDPNLTQQPRLIRLAMGTITSLVFSDNNGNPWLVKSVDYDDALFDDPRGSRGASSSGTYITNSSSPSLPGTAGNLTSAVGNALPGGSNQVSASSTGANSSQNQANSQSDSASSSGTNIVKIAPRGQYAYGNVVIELEGLTAPISFMLASGQSSEVDIRVDARISGRNPNARAEIISTRGLPEHDSSMSDFLDGVAPRGAQQLKISGGQADAWQLGTALYIRTRLTLLSPAFTDHVGSADGMHVYKFYSVSPSVIASANGRPTTLYVSGY